MSQRMTKKPDQQGRSERKADAYWVCTVRRP
jgi:hypothetical protein